MPFLAIVIPDLRYSKSKVANLDDPAHMDANDR